MSQLKEDWGLEGEEDTHLVVFCAFLGGSDVVMTGLSSGGKDAVVNAVEYCVPDDWVFKVPTSLSKTDLYTKALNATGAENPNNCPVHRHKDITNIQGKEFLEDMWKAHGDGRDITHSWTQVTGQDRESRSATLHAPNCMVLFLAEDNDKVSLNDYAEVRNRLLVVSIDDSQELTEQVNTRQAKERAGIIDYNLDTERTEEIRNYVASVPMHLYGEGGSGDFYNPTTVALDNQNPLPQHFTEARRDFPRLMDFMEAVTLFHYDDRMELRAAEIPNADRTDAKVALVSTPTDLWLAMRIFGEQMIMSALNLRDKDFELIKILRRNQGQGLSAADLQMAMRNAGYNITASDVRSSMDNMLTKGYVRKDQSSTPIQYSATPFAAKADRGVNMDWPTIVADTKETIEESLNGDCAERYKDEFLSGDGLLVTHPFTGETVNLMEEEANELEQKVEEQEEGEEEAFEEQMYGNNDGNQNTLG